LHPTLIETTRAFMLNNSSYDSVNLSTKLYAIHFVYDYIIKAPNFRTESWIQKAGKQEAVTVLGWGGRASKIHAGSHFWSILLYV
jgi:hypothetical protein